MSPAPAAPRVTVAIPLYRSRPYLDVIRDNLRALRYPNLEVVVSDRHGLDDAINVLEREFGADSRIAFHRATDGIGWVAHFNYLMQVATGDYFVWMQHDDTFPADYVETLVAAAVRCGRCAIAFGRLESAWDEAGDDDALVALGRFCGPDAWTRTSAHRLLLSGWVGVPFRGAVHRARAMAAVGPLRETVRGCAAEQVWIYALALGLPLVFTPDTYCLKRFHAASATRQLTLSPSMFWAGVRVLPAYLGGLSPARRLEGRCAFMLFAGLRIAYHSVLRRLVSPKVAAAVRNRLYRLVNGRTGPPEVCSKLIRQRSR